MEHSKNSSSNGERRAAALREIGREQSLVTQLRAVVLPALQLAGDDRVQVVADMFKSILDCSAKAMAEVKLLRLDSNSRSPYDDVVDDKRRVRKLLSGDGDNGKQRRRRRKLDDDSVTLETPVPDYDGHQWRKYGQKLISNAKHPRSYYKCTYIKEQGCRATKTVQQQQEDGGGADDPAIYDVVYYGRHTCKPCAETESAAVETGRGADELARSDDSRCSNISVTCTSVVIDHHQHNRTASVESDYNLLDMAGDFAGVELNVPDQLLDVDVFLPFDLDTDWETDAHVHSLLKYGDW